MSYIGNLPPDIGAYEVQSFNGGGTSFTLQRAATTPSVLLFIDGVRQTPTDAYSVSGVTLTTTGTTPSGTDNVTVMFMGDVVDIGAPSDDTVRTAKILDDAVTAAKIDANAVGNSAMADDAVGIAELSATGTASATTFLRGDNSWQTAGVSTLAALTDATVSSSNPTVSTNPSSGVGHLWLNSSTGNGYIATDVTAGANIWTNIGNGTTNIQPTYNVDFLIIAGGGGGGEGNNGRAGG